MVIVMLDDVVSWLLERFTIKGVMHLATIFRVFGPLNRKFCGKWYSLKNCFGCCVSTWSKYHIVYKHAFHPF